MTIFVQSVSFAQIIIIIIIIKTKINFLHYRISACKSLVTMEIERKKNNRKKLNLLEFGVIYLVCNFFLYYVVMFLVLL